MEDEGIQEMQLLHKFAAKKKGWGRGLGSAAEPHLARKFGFERFQFILFTSQAHSSNYCFSTVVYDPVSASWSPNHCIY